MKEDEIFKLLRRHVLNKKINDDDTNILFVKGCSPCSVIPSLSSF